MLDLWMLWLLLVGFAGGIIVAWFLLARLPRRESDVAVEERHREAGWISGTIERHGGVAPASLVEEVLELHQAYLRDPGLQQPPSGYEPYPTAPLPPPAAAPAAVAVPAASGPAPLVAPPGAAAPAPLVAPPRAAAPAPPVPPPAGSALPPPGVPGPPAPPPPRP